MNIPTATEVSWNIPTAYIVQNGPVGILSIMIRTDATWNILYPTEASLNIPIAYITDFIEEKKWIDWNFNYQLDYSNCHLNLLP